jgi:PBP1b-binding outer membrane lipoprotein LpoB
MQKFLVCALFLSLLSLMSCDHSVHRVDTDNVENEVNVRADMKDINIFARDMVNKLRSHPVGNQSPPAKIRVLTVRNETEEPNVPINAITETLITELLNFGTVRVMSNKDSIEEVTDEALYQQSGYGDVGGSTGEDYPDYVLQGALTGIMKRGDGVRDNAYKFILKLTRVRTREVVWQQYKDIRKQQDNSTFGW